MSARIQRKYVIGFVIVIICILCFFLVFILMKFKSTREKEKNFNEAVAKIDELILKEKDTDFHNVIQCTRFDNPLYAGFQYVPKHGIYLYARINKTDERNKNLISWIDKLVLNSKISKKDEEEISKLDIDLHPGISEFERYVFNEQKLNSIDIKYKEKSNINIWDSIFTNNYNSTEKFTFFLKSHLEMLKNASSESTIYIVINNNELNAVVLSHKKIKKSVKVQ
ncbi:hypothetical protein EDEG_02242 [Edhazardia aedis USNM 41457]|uniref:Uncharacterized protein n=1 Tax=Edhazardia aedis (strain USNM 41457) TaxID=1003232 RepID=J9DPY1_EDHAE|nr:hypothetical protein EDEG_02242 [Edhazardia aedis USNM 41457]|eukprot:EJW03422.1 hypothetical protein EDEG_02242 [Edhazardia aedis USNM 41457]